MINYLKTQFEFNDVVLEEIFVNLKNEPESLFSCTRVSREWDGMLWAKKPNFMAHLVLPLLAKCLSFQDLLNCRAVSRNWKRAINGLNSKPTVWDPRIETLPADVEKATTRGLVFSGRSGLASNNYLSPWRFKCDMVRKSDDGTPFPTHTVSYQNILPFSLNSLAEFREGHPNEIAYTHYGYDQYYFRRARHSTLGFHRMLHEFGIHISHLIYRVTRTNICDGLNPYYLDISPDDLVMMLSFVPRLRSLTIMDKGSSSQDFWSGPTPILPNLVSLAIRFRRSAPTITRLLFDAYASQLENLECLETDLSLSQPPHHERVVVFPKLRNLKLAACRHVGRRKYQDHVQKLGENITAPCLERLSVELLHLGENCRLLTHLTARIAAFSPSLVELYVHVVHPLGKLYSSKKCIGTVNFGPLLPHLKIFQISTLFSPLSPQLVWTLRRMPRLQELRFVGDGERIRDWTKLELEHLRSVAPSLERIYFGTEVETLRCCMLPKKGGEIPSAEEPRTPHPNLTSNHINSIWIRRLKMLKEKVFIIIEMFLVAVRSSFMILNHSESTSS